MKSKMIALLLAGTMTVSLAAPSAAWAGIKVTGEQADTYDSAESDRKEVNTRLGIASETDLRKDSGKTLPEWDEMTAGRKKSGMDSALAEADLKDTEILKKDDVIYYIGGSGKLEPVMDAGDAYERVYQLLPLLGGSENTDLRLASRLTYGDNPIYVFQQISDGETVLGSVVKLALNSDGSVSAVFSGLEQGTSKKENQVSEEQAEEVVREYMSKVQGFDAEILTDYTDRINYVQTAMSEALNLDEEQDPVPKAVLWVLYTENPSESIEYPYLAHYLNLDGTYRFNLPVASPGDEESLHGYRKQDVFRNMTAGTYTGEVKDLDGNLREITVPVMHSEEDGRWYLGDVENRIAIADFATVAYSPGHELVLVGSDTNADWDNEDLYLLYNYLRSYDFYKELGWDGPDGVGTDVIILKDLCTSSREPYLNACSIGLLENYSMFGYTGYKMPGIPLGLVEGLDVLGHEYTHTFTGTVMNENLYENDLGAINEAMSDILGNLIEYTYDDTDDTKWELGENTGSAVRSMTDPHFYAQPEYVWDMYYGPETDDPVDANDRGGVHINSSLLNRIGALLVLRTEMSHEEAVHFWTAVAMGLTPRTDYSQIGATLRWALGISGNDEYRDVLDELIEEGRLDRMEIPDTLPLGQKVYKLRLPENEVFEDSNWGLMMIKLNTDALIQLAGTLAGAVSELAQDETAREDFMMKVLDVLENQNPDGKEPEQGDNNKLKQEKVKEVMDLLSEITGPLDSKVILETMAWEEADTGEITFVGDNNPTLYILVNMTEAGTKINGTAILVGDRWIDIGPLVSTAMEEVRDLTKMPAEQAAGESTEDESENAEQAAGESAAEEAGSAEQAAGESEAEGEKCGDLIPLDEIFGYANLGALKDMVKTLSQIVTAYINAGLEDEENNRMEGEEQKKKQSILDRLRDTALHTIDFFFADKSGQADILDDILKVPTEIVYLPTKGLGAVKLNETN